MRTEMRILIQAAKTLLKDCEFFCDNPELHNCEFVSTCDAGVALKEAVDKAEKALT